VRRTVKHWIYQLGGLGFIPLGILDNSVIPLPGSMDVLTVFLSARKQQSWLYYALMATAGSLIGGFLTYRLARKGGKETLARRFPGKTLKKVYKTFEQWSLGAIAIPALLPPPVPMVPFLFGRVVRGRETQFPEPVQNAFFSCFSAAAKRRSRCGSVRGRPVLSSHFSPGLAPQAGQRTVRACSCWAVMAT
jgi:membrane protein YqaA with SNARE-associated domain